MTRQRLHHPNFRFWCAHLYRVSDRVRVVLRRLHIRFETISNKKSQTDAYPLNFLFDSIGGVFEIVWKTKQ